ncbi:MAG: hypothetical protein ACI9FJ_002631 [Alteromonadaceae bacterium]|jgi:hypothetical protein
MDKGSIYYRQVQLLVSALPFVAKERCFALKGGTAINLFVRDFPRLSVDIDLALGNVRNALARIAIDLQKSLKVKATIGDGKPDEMRIIVSTDIAQIKIEVSPVARGTIYEPVEMPVVEKVEDEIGFAEIQVISMADLYGGKICAALDRQHPRDLYDVKMLLESDGITRDIFNGFIAYTLSHNRPIAEVMEPKWRDITDAFHKEFEGMTFNIVSLEALNKTKGDLLQTLKPFFNQQDYDFLMSFKSGSPDWSLAPAQQIQHLPAVKWKLINIGKMESEKHNTSLTNLSRVLDSWLD